VSILSSKLRRCACLAALVSAALIVAACGSNSDSGSKPVAVAGVQIPSVTVKFGNAEFLDHTDSILAQQRGWFKDVGITLSPSPSGALYTPADHAATMLSGKVDVQSSNYQILLPALAKTDQLRCFAYGDFFIGFAMMGKKDFKSFSEFAAEGRSPQDALTAAVAQMDGKTLTWSPDPAVRNFGRTVLQQGRLGLDAIKTESLNDAQGVQLMLSGRADFQIGGAPTRATLEKAGFKPIVTAADLTGLVKPPYASSKVLSAVSTNGWCTTAKYWQQNSDTIMRMASVKWRIDKLIHDKPKETAPVHVRFLNQAAGSKLTPEDAEVIYRSVDPYIPFEDQKDLWFTPGKPTYEPTMIEAAVRQAEQTKVLPKGKVSPQDVTIAPEVYNRALALKASTDRILKDVDGKVGSASGDAKDKATKLVAEANKYYGWYDYLDAERFAKAAQAALAG
jgi:ABC-type nitrate/sulfonate/bicarbonate transport system substrate-binding protein